MKSNINEIGCGQDGGLFKIDLVNTKSDLIFFKEAIKIIPEPGIVPEFNGMPIFFWKMLKKIFPLQLRTI